MPGSQAFAAAPTRLVVGFIAGFLSVLIFASGLIAILHAAGVVRFRAGA